jgi:Tfp pilus assembly protein PilF
LVHLRRGDVASADAAARLLGDDAPELVNLQGTVAMFARDLVRARELLTRATELDANYVPAWLNLARTALASNDRASAVSYLERVLAIEPAQLDAILGLARLSAQAGDFAAADTWLARLPESAMRFSLVGDFRVAQRQFDAAEQSYSRAFELQPSGELAIKLAAAHAAVGRADADAVLHRWLEEHPSDVNVNLTLGSLELDRGDLASATGRFEAIVAANERHAAALNNLAWLYNEAGDARAIEFAERARAAAPTDPRIADTLGWLYVEHGDVARGLALLEEAARALPTHQEIRYHRAVALDESGDRARAADELEALIAGGLEERLRADAEQRLARLRPAR